MDEKKQMSLSLVTTGLYLLVAATTTFECIKINQLDHKIQIFSQEVKKAASPRIEEESANSFTNNPPYNFESNKTYTLPAEEEQRVIKEMYK